MGCGDENEGNPKDNSQISGMGISVDSRMLMKNRQKAREMVCLPLDYLRFPNWNCGM